VYSLISRCNVKEIDVFPYLCDVYEICVYLYPTERDKEREKEKERESMI